MVNMMASRTFDPYRSGRKSPNYYHMQRYDGRNGLSHSLTEPRPRVKKPVELLLPWDHRGERSPDYLCMIFHGRRGRGKSTGATAFARYIYDTNRVKNPNYKVFANYKVNFADMCHPRLVDALITFPEWLHDCLILVDEIAVYFPSVRATSGAALNFSTFLQEIRKLKVDLIFTTQFPTMIIGNASIQIDLFIEPYLYHKVYEPRVKAWVNDSMIMNCVDWWGQWTGHPINHRWPPEETDCIARPKLHLLRNIYHQFNTNEIIPAYWHPSRQEIISREWSDEVEAEDASEAHEPTQKSLTRGQVGVYHTLGELLSDQDNAIVLGSILQEAKKIDPQIKKHRDLAEAMRRQGWSCYQTGKNGPWMGERL